MFTGIVAYQWETAYSILSQTIRDKNILNI